MKHLPAPLPTQRSAPTRRVWMARAVLSTAAAGGTAWLSACGSTYSTQGSYPATPAPSRGAPPPSGAPSSTASAASTPAPGASTGAGKPAAALLPERKYLADWFSGTPVQISFDSDGALRVDVPAEFAFDPGQAKVKPALTKVLDRVGTSLRRVRESRVHVSAPPDLAPAAKPDATLGEKRAQAVKDAVVSRGVNLIRIGTVGVSTTPTVVLRILMPPPGSVPSAAAG